MNSRTSSLPWLSVGQQRPRLQGDPIVFDELDSAGREREIRLENAFFIGGGCCEYDMVVRSNNVESIKRQNSVELL